MYKSFVKKRKDWGKIILDLLRKCLQRTEKKRICFFFTIPLPEPTRTHPHIEPWDTDRPSVGPLSTLAQRAFGI